VTVEKNAISGEHRHRPQEAARDPINIKKTKVRHALTNFFLATDKIPW
jgi:hypothetical protein